MRFDPPKSDLPGPSIVSSPAPRGGVTTCHRENSRVKFRTDSSLAVRAQHCQTSRPAMGSDILITTARRAWRTSVAGRVLQTWSCKQNRKRAGDELTPAIHNTPTPALRTCEHTASAPCTARTYAYVFANPLRLRPDTRFSFHG